MNHDLKDFLGGRELEKQLGSGPYGEVYLEACADPETTRYSAAKIIRIPKDEPLCLASPEGPVALLPSEKEEAACEDSAAVEDASACEAPAALEEAPACEDAAVEDASACEAPAALEDASACENAAVEDASACEDAAVEEACQTLTTESPEERLQRIAVETSRQLSLVKAMRGQKNVAFLEDYRLIPTESGYTVYLRSELLTPLEDYLKEHKPTADLAIQLCLQISEAIDFYEKNGLHHQNIKPSNLFVDSEGNFKLGEPALSALPLSDNEFAAPEAKETPSVPNELFALCAVVSRLFHPKGKLKRICAKACHPNPKRRFRTVMQFQRRLCRLTAFQRMVEYTPPVLLQKDQDKRARRALLGTFLLGVLLVICLLLYGRLSVLFFTKTEPGQAVTDADTPLTLTPTEDGGILLPSLTDRSLEQVRVALERLGIQVIPVYELNAPKKDLILSQSAPANSVLYQTDRLWLLVGCDSPQEVTPRIQSILLPATEISLAVGESTLIEPTVLPEESTSFPVEWSISDPEVLQLQDGTLTALKIGTATLTLRDETGLCTTAMTVTVTPEKVPLPKLVGKTKKDAEKLLKELDLQVSYRYEYSDTVKADVVLAQSPEPNTKLEPGTEVQLTLSLGKADPNHVPVQEVILSHTSLDLKRGETHTLIATILPEDATNPALSWLSSDRSIATVGNGTVTAVSDGTAVIRAISADGSKSVSCTVTVITTSFTVVYEANGGSGAMASTSHFYGELKKLPACQFTRPGYRFAGWALSADAAEPKFLDAQTTGNLSDRDGDVVHLYAVWKPQEYAITYATNGGTLTGEDFFFASYGSTYGPLATPQREGHEFLGWYSDPVYGFLITEDTAVTTISPTTLFARWRRLSVSDPIPVEDLPRGAQIVPGSDYWTYTEASQQKTTAPVEKEGWYLMNTAEEWVPSEETQKAYSVAFPEGFDSAHALYNRYSASLPAEGESGGRRIRYLKSQAIGYIYWHWAQPQQNEMPTNAAVSDKKSVVFDRFSAFESVEKLPTADPDGNTKNGLFFRNRQNQSDGSWWWYAVEVMETEYQISEYTTVYFYEVSQTKTSDTEPTHVANATHWVQYYLDD